MTMGPVPAAGPARCARMVPGEWSMSAVRAGQDASSSWYAADVELVPVAVGEEVQERSPAGDLGAGRERLPTGQHDPVFAG